jgi:hypothetical protein
MFSQMRDPELIEADLAKLLKEKQELPAAGALWPGLHYEVNDQVLSKQLDYIAFPQTEATSRYRNFWIMRRRQRPVVPCPEHTPLPKRGMKPEEKARILSTYLRPWSLLHEHASAAVPHLRDLNVWTPTDRKRVRKKSSSTCDPDGATARSFRRSWRHYIDGNIVSDHAAKIIKNFLLAVFAEGRQQDDSDEENQHAAEPSAPLQVTTPARIKELIESNARQVENDSTGTIFSSKMQAAMRAVNQMLSRMHVGAPAARDFAADRMRTLEPGSAQEQKAQIPRFTYV